MPPSPSGSADFANRPELRRQAREYQKSVDWWFRQHYNLPPTDPRYLDATPEQILLDYYTANAGDGDSEEYEDDDFNLDDVLSDFAADSGEWDTLIDSSPP